MKKPVRAVCEIKGCRKLVAATACRGNGTYYYSKLCYRHRMEKYKIRTGFPNDRCAVCGWEEAPCDRHKLNPEKKYIAGNVIALCPNCHRVIHTNLRRIRLRGTNKW